MIRAGRLVPFRSIRWRLQLWYGLLVAALLVVFALTVYQLEANRWLDQADSELERLADEFSVANRPPPPPGSERGPPRRGGPRPIAEIYQREHAERGIYYALWSRNRGPADRSPNAPADLTSPAGRGVRWNGSHREAFVEGNPGDVALAGRDVAADLAALHGFGWKLAGASVGAYAFTVLIGSWLITRALRPIRDIGEAARQIALGDLSRRIDTRDTDSELGQLAAVLNSTFGRLDAAFAQQARFTADAAHELRTPVTVILTHTHNALASEDLSAEQREAIEAVQRAAQRMRRLIEALLKLARIDAGHPGAEPQPVDLAEIARECVDLVQPLAASRAIRVHADLTPAIARGDRDGLSQVVTNLLANAVQHNREAGEVRVHTRVEGGRALLEVADSGPGIAPEHLPHVFERFYRVDQARTTHLGRTGLGLAIAKAIVDAHGGEITARSTPGAGATFTVRLPGETP